MTLAKQISTFLASTPNGMASDWEIMWALYPDAKQGDRSNGMRIANIRKSARTNNHGFHILANDADMIALTR